ncbi:hypothetical protein HXX76_012916 [Chlamydomonas incerta]|uniref:Uncharacterized protein n=1 Tax=Chlamydomonas incerta TaxID=51695 RepID=A0A835STR5_CHLIN|nr:hypothetical protein HXX76_012916 [Chlamydomonas incerta]|eukprot:KAG2426600.1 hypothetical protein HXX76_012916 [Chlamydomonas incerta]
MSGIFFFSCTLLLVHATGATPPPFAIRATTERLLGNGTSLLSPGAPAVVTWHDGGIATVKVNLSRTAVFETQYVYLCVSAPTIKADFFALNVTGNGTTPGSVNSTSPTPLTYTSPRSGVLRSISYADAKADPRSYMCGPDSPQILFFEIWPRRTGLGYLSLSLVVEWRALYVRPVAPPASLQVHTVFSIYPTGDNYTQVGELSADAAAAVTGYGGTYGRAGAAAEVAVWNMSGALPPPGTFAVCAWLSGNNASGHGGAGWLHFRVTATVNGGAATVLDTSLFVPAANLVKTSAGNCLGRFDPQYLGQLILAKTALGAGPKLPYLEIRSTWAPVEAYTPAASPPASAARGGAKPPPRRAPPPRHRQLP